MAIELLQMRYITKRDSQKLVNVSQAGQNISGLSVPIIPHTSSSKFLVEVYLSIGVNAGGDDDWSWGIRRDSTILGNTSRGATVGIQASEDGFYINYDDYALFSFNGCIVDEPNTTSQVTYHVHFCDDGSSNAAINEPWSPQNTYTKKGISTMIVREYGERPEE